MCTKSRLKTVSELTLKMKPIPVLVKDLIRCWGFRPGVRRYTALGIIIHIMPTIKGVLRKREAFVMELSFLFQRMNWKGLTSGSEDITELK